MTNTCYCLKLKHYNETIIFQQIHVKVYLQAKDMKHCIVWKWQRCCEISVRTHKMSLIQLRNINILWDSIISRALWVKLWSRICPLRVTNLRMICIRQELSVGPEERKPGENLGIEGLCRGGILHPLVPGPLYPLPSQLDNLHAHGGDGRTQPLPGHPST